MNGERERPRPRDGDRRPPWRKLRAGGVRRKLFVFLVLVAVLIALLPTIASHTPLLGMVLSRVVPADTARVSVESASLSWIYGPKLTGVEITDAAGAPLLVAEQINIDHAPLTLFLNPRDLGLITIVRPTLSVKVRPDGSNLEDVAQKLLAEYAAPATDEPAGAPSQPPAIALQLVEGTINAEEVATGRQWRVEALNVQYDTHGVTSGLGRATLSGQISEIARGSGNAIPCGRFQAKLEPTEVGQNQLTFQTEAVSLAVVEPWLRRFVADSQITGTLSGQGTATWTANNTAAPTDLTTSGAFTIDALDATAPALAGDRIRLARVELPWRMIAQPTGLAIEELQLRSEIGQAAVRGRLDPKFDPMRHDIELRGAVDVARLAAMLPHALRIKSDTTITSGTVELAGRCQPQDSGQLITGSVRTAELAATSAGRPLSWDQPVNANFALRRTVESFALDTLQCDSEFLKVNAAGNAQQFTANASFDLNKLSEQLGQFLDLSGVQLAGTGEARLLLQQPAGDQFSATGSADLKQLVVALHEGAAWSEPQLTIRAEAGGLLEPKTHKPTRVDNAALQVAGQGDALDARLTAAVGLTGTEPPVWPVSVRASGQIANWLTRARPFFAADPWQVAGQGEVAALLRLAGNSFEASEIKANVNNLRAIAPGWNISEPRIEFAGDARWDGATSEASVRSAQLVSSSLSLATRDVRYRGGAQAIGQLTGSAAFRADLARLATWRVPANGPPEYQGQGEITGNMRFAQQGERITAEVNATGQNLALASRGVPAPGQSVPAAAPTTAYQTIWQEPQLAFRGAATYDAAADRLTFEQAQLQSNMLAAAAGGSIDKLSTDANVNINGTLNYDLAQVTPLLRQYIGNGIQLTGREQARFALAGAINDSTSVQVQPVNFTPSALPTPNSPLAKHWSRRIRAQLQLPWSGANVYGLPIGAGQLSANLGDGAVQIEPLNLTVGEGKLTAAPNIRLDPEPSELTLPAGPLITNVRISPEVSETMLKFVAPVLAGVTQSEGRFSLALEPTRVPLGQPKLTTSAGKLTVHSVRVVPGAMAKELIGVAQQVESLIKSRDPAALLGGVASATPSQVTLLSISDQQVNFRVVDGRVHHQNLEFQVGDVKMRSQGSVGLDETIALTLQVPIQDAWITKEPLLASLKGQSLQVPVAGTLTRPQLDRGAIASLSTQLLQNTAGQAIGGEINKALDKIFKPRNQQGAQP